MYLLFEWRKCNSRELGIIATLTALSVAGRCLFAAVPGFKPSTFIIICTGYIFGPMPGFMAGATTALVSNLFFGQGPWTVWQMLAWGSAGASAGILGRFQLMENRWVFASFGAAWGFLFGWIMNIYFISGFVDAPFWSSFITASAASFWFDATRSVANAVFAFLLGSSFITIMRRYDRRLSFKRINTLYDQAVPGGDRRAT